MNLTFAHPLCGDIEIKDYPQECFLAVMSKSRFDLHKFEGSVALCLNAHIIKSDNEIGFRVFSDEAETDLIDQFTFDPIVVGVFSEASSVKEFMNKLSDIEKTLH